jgi:hypothetical protein
MTPHAIDKITQSLAKALATHETNQIITLYQNIQNTDFAGGAPIDQENQPMNWNAILKLHYAVRSENYHPKILVLNTTQLSQLLTDTRFIDRDAYPSKNSIPRRRHHKPRLRHENPKQQPNPNETAYAIDPQTANIMLLRRNITLEDWSDPRNDQYGLKTTTRYGLSILQSKAIAKMNNIKSTL